MSLQLDIINASNSDDKITLSVGSNIQSPPTFSVGTGDNKITYNIYLVDLNFCKQMYQPGKIVARLQIALKSGSYTQSDKSYYLLTQDQLITQFKIDDTNSKNIIERKITLSDTAYTDKPIATGYKVYEVHPQYTADSLYVDLIIYSPDYDLTTTIESKTYVAKQLGEEIMKPEFGKNNCTVKVQNKLLYSTNSDEYIHPYLVQYNESFWDMLTRTANRWGEFVYYEDGKLILGHDRPSTSQSISSYTSLSYINESADPVLLANSKKTVTTDDYLRLIKKDNYIEAAGDMTAGDVVWGHKTIQRLLAMKGTIWEFLADWLTGDGLTEAAHNASYLNRRKKEYNKIFFKDPLKPKKNSTTQNKFDELLTRVAKHYNANTWKEATECRQVAYYDGSNGDGGLTETNYKDVRDKELQAGKEVLYINLGQTYQSLRLGDVFKFSNNSTEYLVIGVECKSNGSSSNWKANYYIRAVKQLTDSSSNKYFYPPMLPTGHIRFSGTQRGSVAAIFDWKKQTKMDDPLRSARYRVRNTWQSSAETASPWLRVSHEMLSKNSGAVWQLEDGAEVLLDFEDGNVELPYIVGALQSIKSADEKVKEKTAKKERYTDYTNLNDNTVLYDNTTSRASLFNNMDLCTPAGHAIRLTDGYGGGIANFIASFIPLWKLIQGFNPDKDPKHYEWHYGEYSKFFEGGMEMTDKFGIYSIKASTDERNITMKSPYGDVDVKAFTGITISAPNGDVNIRGKNISIEAGNNITLISGKNVAKGLFGSTAYGAGHNSGVSIGTGVANLLLGGVLGGALNKGIGWCDIPILRHTVETFIRPVNGSIKLHSNKYLIVHAGINVNEAREQQKNINILKSAIRTNNIAQTLMDIADNRASDTTSDYSAWGGCDYKNGDIVFKRQSNANPAALAQGGYKRVNESDGTPVDPLSQVRNFQTQPDGSPDPDRTKHQEQGDVIDKLDATHEGFI